MSNTPNLILGTAGHIDHGKSSLIQALTGVDPDRLKEEKERGITIELGFAQLLLPSGRTMGVVDVPGHERFVRQMVSGATGVDVALLVIAADDGVMPQTVEHVAVLDLLGVTSCVIALTKVDLVDEEWVEFMADEVRAKLAGTPFADAPIVPCSSRTREGLDELLSELDKAAKEADHIKPAGTMRMPIDRVFTVKGFGTVITGTLWSGVAHIGDEIEVLPKGIPTRIRSIQMHGHDFKLAPAGNRVAISLAGLSTEDVRPGDFLAAPGSVTVSDRFDANLTYSDPFASGRILATGTRVHVAHGTREVIGRILCMNGAEGLKPSETALVQIRLEEPLPLTYRDRFIVRSYSPVRVIGGGMVVTAHPRRRTNLTPEEQTMLEALETGDAQAAVDASINLATTPKTIEDLLEDTRLDEATVSACVEVAFDARRVVYVGSDNRYLARPAVVQKAISAIDRALMKFHSANPSATGIAIAALRHQVDAHMSKECFDALLQEAEAREAVIVNGGEASHPKAGAGARAAGLKALSAMETALKEAGTTPPTVDVLARNASVDEGLARKSMRTLAEEGKAIPVEADRFYSAQAIARLQKAVVDHIGQNGPSTAADLKEAMGVSRKFAMPLLEYFDELGITRREGDLRTSNV